MPTSPFQLNRTAFLPSRARAKAALREDSLGDSALIEKRAETTSLQVSEPLPTSQLDLIRTIFDASARISTRIGAHPHFQFLPEGEGERHHCTTVFLDIKNSTHLGIILPPEDAHFLKNAVLRLAIEVFQALGGHIHRLQGDGLFAQFVSRKGDPQRSALAALDAASTFLFLVENHLNPNILEPQQLEPIAVRVGIDYGDDSQVLWARYGQLYCEEFTTTGLHVDLAAKLQSDAPANGVLIGNNVVDLLKLQVDYISIRQRRVDGVLTDDPEFRMQPKNHDFRYRKWVFDWRKWTAHLEHVAEDQRCTITANFGDSHSGPFPHVLRPNGTLPKGKYIEFTASGMPVYATRHRWLVVNQGSQAVVAGQKHNVSSGATMIRSTGYAGLHFAFFTASDGERDIAHAFFPVRVTDG